MSAFDTILYPLKWVVAWVLYFFHGALSTIGMPPASGLTWVLSIVGLVVIMRIILIPLFFKQIKASRGMQMLQPDLQKVQKKYKNKKDPASRQKMQEETMALYKKHGTNPFASCLPILAQSPIFIALFRVLYSLPSIADGSYRDGDPLGPITSDVAEQALSGSIFGATLDSSFLGDGATVNVRIVTAIMIVLMSVVTFTTQRQLTMKNMPASATNNPMARQQRMLMFAMPLIFVFSGVYFPLGVLIYWVTTNLWTMGQQYYTIRKMPAPGSEAEEKFKQREHEKLERRAARKGVPVEDLLPEPEKPPEASQPTGGQRAQPKRKDRQKKSGPPQRPGSTKQGEEQTDPEPAEKGGDTGDSEASSDKEEVAENPKKEAPGAKAAPSGDNGKQPKLTPQERAAKRHAERAERRRQEAQRRREGA